MSEVIALKSCKGCIHVWVCRYRNSLGGTKCNNKKFVKDVRDVVRSTWKQEVVRHPFVHVLYECESCKYLVDRVSNFCPNCGADMRG